MHWCFPPFQVSATFQELDLGLEESRGSTGERIEWPENSIPMVASRQNHPWQAPLMLDVIWTQDERQQHTIKSPITAGRTQYPLGPT